jgi:hypothetical protein
MCTAGVATRRVFSAAIYRLTCLILAVRVGETIDSLIKPAI